MRLSKIMDFFDELNLLSDRYKLKMEIEANDCDQVFYIRFVNRGPHPYMSYVRMTCISYIEIFDTDLPRILAKSMIDDTLREFRISKMHCDTLAI
jgi:hypothetical protein